MRKAANFDFRVLYMKQYTIYNNNTNEKTVVEQRFAFRYSVAANNCKLLYNCRLNGRGAGNKGN